MEIGGGDRSQVLKKYIHFIHYFLDSRSLQDQYTFSTFCFVSLTKILKRSCSWVPTQLHPTRRPRSVSFHSTDTGCPDSVFQFPLHTPLNKIKNTSLSLDAFYFINVEISERSYHPWLPKTGKISINFFRIFII